MITCSLCVCIFVQLVLNGDDRSRLRRLLIDSSSDDDSDDDFDDDQSGDDDDDDDDNDVICGDDQHISSPFGSESLGHALKSLEPVPQLQPEVIRASPRGNGPGCANVVVISTDKTLLFTPISASDITELPRIVGMKHN